MKRYKMFSFLGSLMLLLWCSEVTAQYKQTVTNTVSLKRDSEGLIPFRRLDKLKIAVVTPSPAKYKAFIKMLQNYADVRSFDFNQYDEDTKYSNTIIVAGTNGDLRNDLLLMAAQSRVNNKHVVTVRFDQGESNFSLPSNLPIGTELVVPEFTEKAQRYAAMSIFGGLAITEGPIRTEQTRLQYTQGEGSGLNIAKMTQKIDAIAAEAIREKAAPGMVVMAVKNGQVIFNKAYGSHTYVGKTSTKVSDIFDLASVSKIAGTTPSVMHLQERGVINLDSTMGHYLWQAKNTNKSEIPLRSVMLHEAGFTPFIPFYRYLKPGDLQRFKDADHQVKVADSAYLKNNYYRDVMWPQMLQSDVKPMGNYVYSDISMYVMKEVVEHETAEPMDEYIQKILYRPIGMKTAGYKPRERFDRERIVPTQQDTAFRKVLLQGYVHDEGAAMAGGVAGHAGLFATANDLAIYGQMLLNRGEYGGARYFKPETVDMFTSKQSQTSRRGLGFDRYEPKSTYGYPSKLVSESVFGHTGYTGTCIWMDPRDQLIYIFLSNRVHPQVSTKLYDFNIRSRIQDAIYETINEAK